MVDRQESHAGSTDIYLNYRKLHADDMEQFRAWLKAEERLMTGDGSGDLERSHFWVDYWRGSYPEYILNQPDDQSPWLRHRISTALLIANRDVTDSKVIELDSRILPDDEEDAIDVFLSLRGSYGLNVELYKALQDKMSRNTSQESQ